MFRPWHYMGVINNPSKGPKYHRTTFRSNNWPGSCLEFNLHLRHVFTFFKRQHCTLAGVALLAGCCPMHQEAAGLIPGQVTCLDAWSSKSMLCSHIDFSLPPCPSHFLYTSINYWLVCFFLRVTLLIKKKFNESSICSSF